MPATPAEPFHLALAGLRDRLRDGGFAPGARIAATEVADTLKLSATPVREALSRLAGEGLLEDRRGQGFFLRALSGLEIADLFRMSLSELLIAQDSRRAHNAVRGGGGAEARDDPALRPIVRVERLFTDWIAEAGSRTLSVTFRTLQIQLGPVRRAEPEIIPDLQAEADELQALAEAADAAARGPALRRFHLRRVALADRLAALAYRGQHPSKV
jgi:DNA-binding GntR family transcriptional regulator